jgi:carbon storage regulator
MNKPVFTRRVGQSVVVDDHIRITILEVNGRQVRVAIEAPREVNVVRAEIKDRPRRPREAVLADTPAASAPLAGPVVMYRKRKRPLQNKD